jgi:BMFP domain-containing protein YqiC
MAREAGAAREQEAERLRELELSKKAEVAVQERLVAGLRADKKDLEQRIEDLLTRMDSIDSRNAQEHHNTVKYFENLVAQYKI